MEGQEQRGYAGIVRISEMRGSRYRDGDGVVSAEFGCLACLPCLPDPRHVIFLRRESPGRLYLDLLLAGVS